MQTHAPSIGRILVAVGFTLSCFALLLFLWVTFGGSVPFKPESYRLHRRFPRGDHAVEGGRRQDRRSLGRQGEEPRPGARRAPLRSDGLQHDQSDDRDRAAVRADLLGREGDPPLEDPARGDLRRAHLGQPGPAQARPPATSPPSRAATAGQISGGDAPQPIPEGGHLAQSQVQNRPRSTRSSRGSTSPRARRSSPDAEIRLGDQRPRTRSQQRLRQPRAVRIGRERRARHAPQSGTVAPQARARHG